MRRLLALLLVLPSLVWAGQGMGPGPGLSRAAGGGGGGGGAWYYGAPGTDTFAATASTGASYCNGGVVSGVTGLSVTKLSYKQATLNAATAAKVAAFDTGSPANLLGSATASSLTADAWIDVTITPFTASGNVRVCVGWNGNTYAYKNISNNGVWASITYASYPPSTLTLNTDTNNAWAVRVYAQ